MAEAARQMNVILAPGTVFSASKNADNPWRAHLRFNVAQSLDPRVYATLKATLA